MLKFLSFLFLAAITTVSCESVSEKTQSAAVKGMEQSDKENKTISSTTSIQFDTTVHDFGKIRQGEMVSHTFKFTNTGNTPLIISNAKASCGCTVPEYPKDPVAPGAEGEIVVKYNGSGRGEVQKTVTITANTKEANTILTIKANVKPMDASLKGPVKKSE